MKKMNVRFSVSVAVVTAFLCACGGGRREEKLSDDECALVGEWTFREPAREPTEARVAVVGLKPDRQFWMLTFAIGERGVPYHYMAGTWKMAGDTLVLRDAPESRTELKLVRGGMATCEFVEPAGDRRTFLFRRGVHDVDARRFDEAYYSLKPSGKGRGSP